MKRIAILLLIISSLLLKTAIAQEKPDYTKIDIMLVNGEITRVIDTCQLILMADSLNADIYYKLGLAYQSSLPDDKSFDCFIRASELAPENNMYRLMVAKGYYSKSKYNQAKPIFENLLVSDSLNWTYAYYLTSILMLDKEYDKSLEIYQRFYNKDSLNYVILDKIGFAMLRKGFYPTAIDYYNRSLAINKNNVGSIKNLSFLYASTNRTDTALQLLTMGMKIDPTDMDLWIRRAALNYTLHYTKRALDDYLKILASGDSTLLYLKRAGIGYSNNLQPKEAEKYLLLAYKKDSSDIEVSTFLARNYQTLKDLKKSAYYYQHIINTLDPFMHQLSFNYIMLAEILKSDLQYKEAIAIYLKGQRLRPDINISMIIANIYDEKLNDIPNAIRYYEMYLENLKNTKVSRQSDYMLSIQKRLDYLKEKQNTANK